MSWKTPHPFTDAELAFPATVLPYMPTRDEIPKEFTKDRHPAVQVVDRWFFRGLRGASFSARDGIDEKQAIRHLKVILGSREPEHGHKTAAAALLIHTYFEMIVMDDEVIFDGRS